MESVTRFLAVSNGYGFGNNDCYPTNEGKGYGGGNSSGRGYDHGYHDCREGCGNGYGRGYGNGYLDYSCGKGYGIVCGRGNGKGYSDRYCKGNGYGKGLFKFDDHDVYDINGRPTCLTSIHGDYATGFTIKDNTVKVPCYVAKVGDFFAHGETLEQARTDAQAKKKCHELETEPKDTKKYKNKNGFETAELVLTMTKKLREILCRWYDHLGSSIKKPTL